ncbi:MAG: hypothetical protein U0520_01985 [Candidatus Saccharimonadales bacterium]
MSEQTDSVDQEVRRFWPPQLNLVSALAIAIAAAGVIVGVAYTLYWNSPNRKYDIERGGSAHRNQALSVEDDDADTTSPVDAPAAKRKIQYLEEELRALNGLSKFSADDLNNQAIQLAPPEQPSL